MREPRRLIGLGSEAPALEAVNVSVQYRSGRNRIIALDGISLLLPKGSFGLIRGPSGSGKSTLLGVLGAMIRPSAGGVYLKSIEITSAAPSELARMRRRIGFLFQNLALLDRLTAWENVATPLIAAGVCYRERRDRAESLLARFGLEERMDATVGELSGGEQQRVAFVRALIASPDIVLADEPTASLDESSGADVIRLLSEQEREGRTVLVASHDARFEEYASHIWTMQSGRILRSDRCVIEMNSKAHVCVYAGEPVTPLG